MVLATADTYERLGDHDQALLVLERESNGNNVRWPYGARFARERGRLAALTGDTDRAIREYRFYVYLRASPEPALEAEVWIGIIGAWRPLSDLPLIKAANNEKALSPRSGCTTKSARKDPTNRGGERPWTGISGWTCTRQAARWR